MKRSHPVWALALVAALTVLGIAAAAAPDSHDERAGEKRVAPVSAPTDDRDFTLEDTYGDDGVNYQGALGFMVLEGSPSAQPIATYGVGVDDMVVEWKEVRLDEDTTTNCASTGSCATLDTSTDQVYTGLTAIAVTVTDASPGKGGNDDCDHNGVYTDAGVDKPDCDNDGRRDVYVKAWSDAEPAGEWVILNETTAIPGTSGVFEGSVPVSSSYDSPGTVFVQRSGSAQPDVTLRYADPDDGTGSPCRSNSDPAKWGILERSVQINVTVGSVVVRGSRITNDLGKGDGDGFADTNETVNLYVTVVNKTGKDLTRVVARLASNSPYVDCIFQDTVSMASLPKGATLELPNPFKWKVSGAAVRLAGHEYDDFHATFNLTISADQFDASLAPQQVIQDLDLDAAGGGTPSNFSEGFENPTGFGLFTSMTLDTGVSTNGFSDGKRCQYNDPDFPNTGSYGQTYCYLGFANEANNTYDWHLHTTAMPDGGRAYAGGRSLHWGYHLNPGDPKFDDYKFSQMDAIVTAAPVNLGMTPVTPGDPELSFKHQINLMDYRAVGALFMQAPDRAVVELQLADLSGNQVGVWQKIAPYSNVYDIQPSNNYINCSFDPDDDGNNEDSYFDPTDPYRSYGPSSTCWPEFVFGSQGSTDYRYGFVPGNVNRASDDKVGLAGSAGPGDWVETKFDLSRYRGRRVKVRFLATTIKVYDYTDPIALGFPADRFFDDGWYIDDVRISNTLTSPATFSADTKDNSSLPACPLNCTSVTASLAAEPATTVAPGQPVSLDASASVANTCVGGVLQFRFYVNGVLARDWTDNAFFSDAPLTDASYDVSVRCSTRTDCVGTTIGSTGRIVTVGCPSTGSLTWPGPLRVDKTGGLGGDEPDQGLTVSWGPQARWTDLIRGDLVALRTGATYTGTVLGCDLADTNASSAADGAVLAPGSGFYFLARGAACNVTPFSYSAGAPKERGSSLAPRTRDAEIGADPRDCP